MMPPCRWSNAERSPSPVFCPFNYSSFALSRRFLEQSALAANCHLKSFGRTLVDVLARRQTGDGACRIHIFFCFGTNGRGNTGGNHHPERRNGRKTRPDRLGRPPSDRRRRGGRPLARPNRHLGHDFHNHQWHRLRPGRSGGRGNCTGDSYPPGGRTGRPVLRWAASGVRLCWAKRSY